MIVTLSKFSAAALVAATVITAGDSSIFLPPKFETVDDVPSRYFKEDRVIYGRVERAIDGDTVRIRHCRTSFYCEDRMKKVPTSGSRRISLEPPKRIYDSTLSIRLYGVDCPEIQKRKNDPPSQPFGDEAKEYVTNLVLGKKVKVTLLSKDTAFWDVEEIVDIVDVDDDEDKHTNNDNNNDNTRLITADCWKWKPQPSSSPPSTPFVNNF
ncbi:hypothetical protein FRACYDRAFT_244448 [Fragilariopsis cylindrus CCMP1102]|uniref:TNase-like domain-containing protein n=1 Tax=Fragilariopsis cylindrus CCMP1102 TaxID=635003 RepID=A0A1E7F1V0_9STRA|nr:hypothetical protein FRACYDRAFT_244448 [Fragilariopsis cylindrus CCMP1102]|eukprot:OEU12191.1 hypothetical protein FRACYDRAFT_244448 [Fragilariopsis cylindrus CCMP1102]